MAYMITVAFLLLPYIVFESPLVALGFCLFDAALIIWALPISCPWCGRNRSVAVSLR